MSMTQANADDRAVRYLAGAEELFRLGLICAIGETAPADRIAAHKWFNIAGMRGSSEAVRHRCELAGEMSSAEIAAAQRAARLWLTRH
ncbi:MAG TPA: sel1 repeat family protein [Xanthobacteraceae bacterium]|nr:sel1 repeat family protein [Xanthobacteraceae bacterium]